jgi:hypothetical protein
MSRVRREENGGTGKKENRREPSTSAGTHDDLPDFGRRLLNALVLRIRRAQEYGKVIMDIDLAQRLSSNAEGCAENAAGPRADRTAAVAGIIFLYLRSGR